MSARSTAAIAVIAACAVAVCALAGAESPRRRAAYPSRLPAGVGRDIAERGCLVCHSAMLIVQQRKDSTAWEKTVKQMEAWGAPVAPEDHGPLIRYFSGHLGTKSPRR